MESITQPTEENRQAAADAAEAPRTYAQNAVDAAGERMRDLQHDAEPTMEQIAARMQEAVQRGLRSASEASARAQRKLEQATERTSRYIADQPLRSVLYAAATGAALTALIVLAARHRDDR